MKRCDCSQCISTDGLAFRSVFGLYTSSSHFLTLWETVGNCLVYGDQGWQNRSHGMAVYMINVI